MKLLDKTRNGAKVYKVYDKAQTPYQRLLKSDVLIETRRQELAATYHSLNPVLLLNQSKESQREASPLFDSPRLMGLNRDSI